MAINPYKQESYNQKAKRSLTIDNTLPTEIVIGERRSNDWHNVKFVIATHEYWSSEINWLAELKPGDRVKFDFTD